MVHDFSLIDHLSAERSEKKFTLRHELFPKCTRRNGCLSVVFNDDFSHPLRREWSILYGGQRMDGRWRKVFLFACGLEKNKKESLWRFSTKSFLMDLKFSSTLFEWTSSSVMSVGMQPKLDFPGGFSSFLSSILDITNSQQTMSLVKVAENENILNHPHLKLHHVDEPENEDEEYFPYTLRFNLRRWKCLLN